MQQPLTANPLGAFPAEIGAESDPALQRAMLDTLSDAVIALGPGGTVLAAMGGEHMVIGLGEAVITMLIVAVVMRARPEQLEASASAGRPARRWRLAYGAALATGLAVVVAPHASSLPDGLEHVAERFGFAGRAVASQPAPLPDYAVVSLADASPWLATVIAGGLGALVAFAVAWFVARALAATGRTSAGH